MRLLGIVLIVLVAFEAAGENATPNGDFETADVTGKLPVGWRPQASEPAKGHAEWATDAAHSPTHALKLFAIEGQPNLNWQSDYFACDGPVEVRVWLRAEAVTAGPQSWQVASVTIRFLDAEKKDILRPHKTYGHFDVAHAEGTTPWTQFRERISTPDRAKWARISFSLSRGRGTAWLDDVEARPVPKTGLEALADEEARRLALAAPAKLPPTKPGYRYVIEDFNLPATYPRAEHYWQRVPPPEIRDGNFWRDGKPVFLVGTEASTVIYPWLYRLLGIDYVTLDACEEGSRIVKVDDGARLVTVGAEARSGFLTTEMRRLLEVGVLPYISLAEGSERYNPLRQYFPELSAGPTCHYYMWNYWHPDARRIRHNSVRAMLSLTRRFPTFGYEMYNEIYYMSYDENSLRAFREATRAKFDGNLDRANKLWGTAFTSWDAVQPPVRSVPWTSAEVLPEKFSLELWAEWVKFTEERFERIVEDCRREMKGSVPDGRFFVQIPAELTRGYAAPGTDPRRVVKHEDIYSAEHGMAFVPQYEGAENPPEIRAMLRGLLGRDAAASAAAQADLPIVDSECPLSPGAKEQPNDATIVDLAGKWKFAPGDEPGRDPARRGTDLEDSGWKEIDVPGMWGRQGWPDATVGWYRKRVRLDVLPPKAFLCGSELADDAQLWVNGHWVHRTAKYNEKFSVEVTQLLKPNAENVIVTRIENHYRSNGFIWGGIRDYLKLLRVSLKAEPLTVGQMRAFLWESAIHGYSAITLSYYYPSEGFTSSPVPIDPRRCDPRAVAEIPRTKAEINSVADLVLPKPRIRTQTALFYPYESWRASVPPSTRELVSGWLTTRLLTFYGGAMFAGFTPAILSSDQIIRGDAEKFRILIIALAPRVPAAMLPALKAFVEKGGILLVTTDSLTTEDEFGQSLPPLGVEAVRVPVDEDMAAFRERMVALVASAGLRPPVSVTASGRRPPFIEAHVFGNGERGLLYLMNWGKTLTDLEVQCTALAAPTQAAVLRLTELPSQAPVIYLYERGELRPLPTPQLSAEQRQWLPMLYTAKSGGKKKVLIDAHHWCIFTRLRMLTLVKALEDHGFAVHTLLSPIEDKVEVWDGTVHGAALKDYDVLVMAGFAQLGTDASDAEVARIKQFVAEGGGLFLAAQHYRGQHGHMGTRRASRIAESFGIRIGYDAVLDPEHCAFEEPRFITYDALTAHPITAGCRVFQSGGAASLSTQNAPQAVRLISTHDHATATTKQQGPYAIAVALQHERGRVVVMGDADWLEPLTLAKADNEKLAIGIFEWLVGLR